ncbi:MAG TPA: DUF5663 domain-containing protein [Candidatus Paceibacterota bacterium]|nr:DUF5663 domain-containing protein [Candidatus Paceibacterota bacterium]
MNKLPLTHANIVKLLGLESLPLDERKEILESASELVETRTFNRVMEVLPEAKRAEFSAMLESQNKEKLPDFFNQNNIDLVAITEEEVEKVKQELLAEKSV